MTVPSEKEFIDTILLAKSAGDAAAEKRVVELLALNVPKGKIAEAFGGASLTIDVDGRTALGRFLSRLNGGDLLSISKGYPAGYSLSIRYDVKARGHVSGQEFSILEEANKAALDVIKNALGLEGYVRAYAS